MHPDIVAQKRAEEFDKVLSVVIKHAARDEEFERLVAGPGGPGVGEIREAAALGKLAELVDELYEIKTTSKKSAAPKAKKS